MLIQAENTPEQSQENFTNMSRSVMRLANDKEEPLMTPFISKRISLQKRSDRIKRSSKSKDKPRKKRRSKSVIT